MHSLVRQHDAFASGVGAAFEAGTGAPDAVQPTRHLEPAVRLAETGFAISPRLHSLIAEDKYLKRYPAAAASFHDAAGNPLPVGHLLKTQAYADTLQAVSARGTHARPQTPR